MINKPRFPAFCACVALLAGASLTATAQGADAPDGAKLFVSKACAGCHGPDGRTPVVPLYPKIAGQKAGYLYNQLRDFKSGDRSNSQAMLMKGIVTPVSDEEMRTIANWLSTQ